MAKGMEMMLQSLIKSSGFDPVKVQADIETFRDTVVGYIEDDKATKKRLEDKIDSLLLLVHATRADVNILREIVSYSRDPLSIEPESSESKFAHFLEDGQHSVLAKKT